MSDFFRFPHTPHLAWLGREAPRDDKVLSSHDALRLLEGDVIVEEKLDGANIGISCHANGELRAQNRGQYLDLPTSGQFSRLHDWIYTHTTEIQKVLTPDLILFGEWCSARHSITYDKLPDWFLLFDVYDKSACTFWSVTRRNALGHAAGLKVVPTLFTGTASIESLTALIEGAKSLFGPSAREGVVVRRDVGDWNEARAKLVSSEFTQSITAHWRNRHLQWNRLSLATN